MRSSRLLLPLAALWLTVGCAPRFDAATEAKTLLARDAEWADAALAGKDLDKIVSYWSDDALVVPQGQPSLEGKAAIRAYVDASLKIPGFRIHWTSDEVLLPPGGKMAIMQGTNEMTAPGSNGVAMTLYGRAVTVWRLDPDGQWRCVADI